MSPTAPGARIAGVDVARCLALVGMMATHILPGVVDGEVTLAQEIAGGRSSALFAVLAGVSLSLVAGRSPVRGRAWTALAAGILVRSVLIGLIGLLLGEADTGIAVILVFYAVLFVVVAPFLALATPALVALALAWTALGPWASQVLRHGLPMTSYAVPSLTMLADPVELVRDLLLTGYYPVATWAPYLLLGMVLGRVDLRRPRVAGGLVVSGLALAPAAHALSARLLAVTDVRSELVASFEGAGWLGDLDTTLVHGLYGTVPTGSRWWLAVAAPHSGTSLDLVATAGSAVAVLGMCLLLGAVAPRTVTVVFGAGALTLSLYTLHVVLRAEGLWDGDSTGTFVGQVVLVLAVGAAFGLAGRRGPLEVLVGEASKAARRAVAARG